MELFSFRGLNEIGDANTASQDTESNNVAQDLFPDSEVGRDDIDGKSKKSAGATIINAYDPSKKTHLNDNRDEDNDDEPSHFNEAFLEAVTKYMDFHDKKTNDYLFSLNEEEQNTFIVTLTNKLYNMMIDKVDEVDYGDIPRTKGNITMLPKYNEIRECIKVLQGIFSQYKEDTKPIDNIESALNYLEDYTDLFSACYAGKIELGIAIYNNIALGIVCSISYMIAVCIEYIKSPKREGMEVMFDKAGVIKVKESLLYESLCKFNDAARKGDIENALKPLIKNRAKGFGFTTIALGIVGGAVIFGLILACVSMIRDMVYFFYATRARVSEYFDIQANLLEMNANTLENSNTETVGEKKSVIRRQLAIARMFHKLADAIAISSTKAERQATNDIKKDNSKNKIDDVETNGDGPLF